MLIIVLLASTLAASAGRPPAGVPTRPAASAVWRPVIAPSAADSSVAGLPGRYTFDRAASDDVDRAIDAAVRPMNFLVRGVARTRLRRNNPTCERLTLALSATQISTTFDAGAPIVTPASGRPVAWTRDNGDAFQVAMRVTAGRLVQTFVGRDGRREDVYALGRDGATLTVGVTVSSPRLPRALVYRLVYRRE